jgi:predicted lipoprotein with Yx(FWY)xxD motif
MPRTHQTGGATSGPRRGKRSVAMLLACIAGFSLAALTGLAVAKSFTLSIDKNAKVTNFNTHASKHENVYANSHGVVVYTLTHDSIQHPGCTKANGCFAFWFPVTVAQHAKLSKAAGIKGTLGTFHRNGFFQLTLDKHPLYTFKLDNNHKGIAMGEAIASFGGVWHVAQDKSSKNTSTTPPMMGTTTTTPCIYGPPC